MTAKTCRDGNWRWDSPPADVACRADGQKAVAGVVKEFCGIDVSKDFDRMVVTQQNASNISRESPTILLTFLERIIGTDKLLCLVQLHLNSVEKLNFDRREAVQSHHDLQVKLEREKPIFYEALNVREQQKELLGDYISLRSEQLSVIQSEMTLSRESMERLSSGITEASQSLTSLQQEEAEECRLLSMGVERETYRRKQKAGAQSRLQNAKSKLEETQREKDDIISAAKDGTKKLNRLKKAVSTYL